jgi:hypothetical protein
MKSVGSYNDMIIIKNKQLLTGQRRTCQRGRKDRQH